MMELDVSALRAFVTVVEEEQFGGAAGVLGLSQQAVSKRIAKLETQLGAVLLERRPGRTVPTEAGARLLPHARTVLVECAAAAAAVQDRPGPLRVAIFGERIAPLHLMRSYLATRPEADVELVLPNGAVRQMISGADPSSYDNVQSTHGILASGLVDAAFARLHGSPRPLPGHVRASPAYLEPLHLLVGKRHPLADRSSVTLREIAPYTAWMPGAAVESEWAEYYRRLTEFSGIVVETGSRPESFELMVDRVATSASVVTFVGEGGHTPWHPDSRQLPISDPTPAYPWALLRSSGNEHPELPPLVRYFDDAAAGRSTDHYWIPESDRALFTR